MLRQQTTNYKHVEHIEFDRLQNSVVDVNGFQKLTAISFPVSQFDTSQKICDHITSQRHTVTLHEGAISVACVSILIACRCAGLHTPCHMAVYNYCASMLQRRPAHYTSVICTPTHPPTGTVRE